MGEEENRALIVQEKHDGLETTEPKGMAPTGQLTEIHQRPDETEGVRPSKLYLGKEAESHWLRDFYEDGVLQESRLAGAVGAEWFGLMYDGVLVPTDDGKGLCGIRHRSSRDLVDGICGKTAPIPETETGVAAELSWLLQYLKRTLAPEEFDRSGLYWDHDPGLAVEGGVPVMGGPNPKNYDFSDPDSKAQFALDVAASSAAGIIAAQRLEELTRLTKEVFLACSEMGEEDLSELIRDNNARLMMEEVSAEHHSDPIRDGFPALGEVDFKEMIESMKELGAPMEIDPETGKISVGITPEELLEKMTQLWTGEMGMSPRREEDDPR